VRVAYYNELINLQNGGGAHARGLLGGFKALGHEVSAIPPLAELPAGTHVTARRLPLLPEPLRGPARDALGRIKALRRARGVTKRVASLAPDVLVARRMSYDYILPGVIDAARCPVVAECNTVLAVESLQYRGQRVVPWEARRERDFLRAADLCVAITDEVAEQLQAIGVDPRRTKVVANGVDLALFDSSGAVDGSIELWRRQFSFVIGYCAGVGPIHDLATVASAATVLARTFPDVGFLFIGPTPSDVAAAGMPTELVEARCLAVGPVVHARVPSLLRGADMFWAALNNTHGSPLKIYEYFAMGRPTLMAARGSGIGPIQSAGGGAVVDKGDVAGLVDAATVRIGRPEMVIAEGSAALEWVRLNGTWTGAARQILDALDIGQ